MIQYITVVISIIVLLSLMLSFFLNKKKLLNIQIFLAITISSIISITISLIFPFILIPLADNFGVVPGTLIIFVGYITLILFATIIVSSFISEKRSGEISLRIKNSQIYKHFNKINEIPVRISKLIKNIINTASRRVPNNEKPIAGTASEMLEITSAEVAATEAKEEIFIDTQVAEETLNVFTIEEEAQIPTEQNMSDTGINYLAEENSQAEGEQEKANLEKSVDSEKIIDTMRIETFESNTVDFEIITDDYEENEAFIEESDTLEEEFKSDVDTEQFENQRANEDLSINDCIEEAFRLKQAGDLEGSILYYLYALDKQPENDTVFLIILDICVLYKTLGQSELAREILASYIDSYGNIMDAFIREEIENNL